MKVRNSGLFWYFADHTYIFILSHIWIFLILMILIFISANSCSIIYIWNLCENKVVPISRFKKSVNKNTFFNNTDYHVSFSDNLIVWTYNLWDLLAMFISLSLVSDGRNLPFINLATPCRLCLILNNFYRIYPSSCKLKLRKEFHNNQYLYI